MARAVTLVLANPLEVTNLGGGTTNDHYLPGTGRWRSKNCCKTIFEVH